MSDQISEMYLQLVQWSSEIFKDRFLKLVKALLERGRSVSAAIYFGLFDLGLLLNTG